MESLIESKVRSCATRFLSGFLMVSFTDLSRGMFIFRNSDHTYSQHQDELEREVSRLQDKLARSQKKSSKTGVPDDPRSSLPSMSSSASTRSESVMSQTTSRSGEDVCEICEQPGHDIFSCDLLKDERPLSSNSEASFLKKNVSDDLFCEDCEEHGHTAANCPHSLDVF